MLDSDVGYSGVYLTQPNMPLSIYFGTFDLFLSVKEQTVASMIDHSRLNQVQKSRSGIHSPSYNKRDVVMCCFFFFLMHHNTKLQSNFTAFSFLNECLLALLTTDTDEQCGVKLKTTKKTPLTSVRKSLIYNQSII